MVAATDTRSRHQHRGARSRGQTTASRRGDDRHWHGPCSEQHGLFRSILLHLLPGAALFGCVVGAAAIGIEPVVALLFGIELVIAPLQLGYLFVQGKRRNNRWSLAGVVDYDERFSARQIARSAA